MDQREKQKAKRDEFVISMAKKLAVGNGPGMIAAAKRKKKHRKLVILSSAIGAFLLCGLIIYFHMPKHNGFTPQMMQEFKAKRNPVHKIFTDYNEKNISADQYALYLKDLLVRYDSLPQVYKIEKPCIKASEIYDSLASVWSKVHPNSRVEIIKILPDIEKRIQEK